MKIATDTLLYLFHQYKKIELLEKEIQYESLINARLPKQLLISIL